MSYILIQILEKFCHLGKILGAELEHTHLNFPYVELMTDCKTATPPEDEVVTLASLVRLSSLYAGSQLPVEPELPYPPVTVLSYALVDYDRTIESGTPAQYLVTHAGRYVIESVDLKTYTVRLKGATHDTVLLSSFSDLSMEHAEIDRWHGDQPLICSDPEDYTDFIPAFARSLDQLSHDLTFHHCVYCDARKPFPTDLIGSHYDVPEASDGGQLPSSCSSCA